MFSYSMIACVFAQAAIVNDFSAPIMSSPVQQTISVAFPTSQKVFNTIADLRAAQNSVSNPIYILGAKAIHDGGGGFFYWDPNSTQADDGVTVLQQTGQAVGRWRLLSKFVSHVGNPLDLAQFGAIGDGVTDDTAAIQAWLNAGASGYALTAPAGTFLFSSPLSIVASDFSIVGAGPYQTVFKYVGSNQNVDLLSVGTFAHESVNGFMQGFKITSNTPMQSGAGIHCMGLCRSQLRDVVADGQDGSGNLHHGFWFDQIDFVRLDQFEAKAIGDAVRVNGKAGGGAKSDLLLTGGKIASSGVGIHIGGAFGGFICDQVDVIANSMNVLIDNSIVQEENRELFFLPGCLIDSAIAGDSVVINDPLSSGSTLHIGGWVASGAGHGINVKNWRNGKFSIQSPVIWNFKGDGLHVEDPTTFIMIGGGTLIHTNGGYGVNATNQTNTIFPGPSPVNNQLGAYSPNALIENLGYDQGFIKFPNGKIVQWFNTTFTGPANTILTSAKGNPIPLPIPFPNTMIDCMLTATCEGFSNGAIQSTLTVTPYANTAVYVSMIASGNVNNPQTVKVVAWGY